MWVVVLLVTGYLAVVVIRLLCALFSRDIVASAVKAIFWPLELVASEKDLPIVAGTVMLIALCFLIGVVVWLLL